MFSIDFRTAKAITICTTQQIFFLKRAHDETKKNFVIRLRKVNFTYVILTLQQSNSRNKCFEPQSSTDDLHLRYDFTSLDNFTYHV